MAETESSNGKTVVIHLGTTLCNNVEADDKAVGATVTDADAEGAVKGGGGSKECGATVKSGIEVCIVGADDEVNVSCTAGVAETTISLDAAGVGAGCTTRAAETVSFDVFDIAGGTSRGSDG